MRAPQLRVHGLSRPAAPRHAVPRGTGDLIGELFPAAGQTPARPDGRPRWLFATVNLAALALGTVAMLARISGSPPWRSLYAEDLGVYLPQALAHPWHLLQSYAGYLQLAPRLIAQAVALLPIRDGAAGFAVAGALVASGCGLFVYHASSGHISSRWLRALAGLSVVLLPVAQLGIADNGVNAPWYLLAAIFWAILWRPASRAGAWAALAVGFIAAASNPLALLYAPLLAARAIALPWRIREHAVTAGWAAGSVLQVLVILTSHIFRTATHDLAWGPLYYSRDVVLPALGWHLAWLLRHAIGLSAASLLVGGVLLVVLAVAVVTQGTRVRVFVVTAVATGLVFTLISAVSGWGGPDLPVALAVEPGSRYSTVPILLLDAALIVAADAYARRWRPRPQAIAAVAVLAAVLAAGWVWDFRYPVVRTDGPAWTATAAAWLRYCHGSPARSITVSFPDYFGKAPLATSFSCASLRR
jgi:hypothetical protein